MCKIYIALRHVQVNTENVSNLDYTGLCSVQYRKYNINHFIKKKKKSVLTRTPKWCNGDTFILSQKDQKSIIDLCRLNGKDDIPLSLVDQPFMDICELIYTEKTFKWIAIQRDTKRTRAVLYDVIKERISND